jgi:hypothetical protein
LGLCDSLRLLPHRMQSGGGGWIRTNVGVSQQIYSLPPLATRAPLRRERIIMTTVQRNVKRCTRTQPSKISPALTYTGFPAPESTKPPPASADGGSCGQREPDDYLLSHGQSALSSAWSRFTVLFGMGRGGTDSLWSSGLTCCRTAFGAIQPIWEEVCLRGNVMAGQ